MERRNGSLKALERLNYIDSLDDDERADLLRDWTQAYLDDRFIKSLDLHPEELIRLSELLARNITFLNNYRMQIKTDLENSKAIRKFLS